jgi:hypothetical protein
LRAGTNCATELRLRETASELRGLTTLEAEPDD